MGASYIESVFGLEIKCPNLKRLFIPDPGYVIIDVDLEQADAQVVAWESGCKRLKKIFKDPDKDLHDENTKLIFKIDRGMIESKEISYKEFEIKRFKTKGGVHGTNYRGQAPTIGKALGISTAEAEVFQSIWFADNPEIKQWHEDTESQILVNGYLENKFGFRRIFLDRVTPNLLNEAQAWVPQSTVGHVINQGWMNIEDNINEKKEYVEVLLQTHDSLTMQVRREDFYHLLPDIRENMLIKIPYEDPLIIGLGSPEVSEVSYGETAKVSWEHSDNEKKL